MSLTSFIDSSATLRARLLSEFSKPHFKVKAELKAPPLTQSHGLTGTAFDYLLRFYAAKLNPNVQTHRWTAQAGVARLASKEKPHPALESAKKMFKEAQERYKTFLASDTPLPPRDLIESSVRLAYLENIHRINIVDDNAFKPLPAAILDDLQAMLDLLRSEDFRASTRCILNPTFGSASALVGGADADLIIDDTLIDIKSGKHLELSREIFNQIVGYYVLSCIGGIDNCPPGKLNYVAVYYARYGVLHRLKLSDFVVEARMSEFIEWFKECAKNKA
jgi:hypothetical protein